MIEVPFTREYGTRCRRAFALRVSYRRINGRLRQHTRTAHHHAVQAWSEGQARIRLVADYKRRGFQVLQIERI